MDDGQFSGRVAEIRTIVDNCEANRFTVVTAAPGLGVSWLFRSGAVPVLRQAGYIAVVFSDWQGRTVSARLRDAITNAIHEQADGGFVAGAEPLRDLLETAERQTGWKIAVLLDQFEDYHRFHVGTDISDSFDAELSNAISARTSRFVIGMQDSAVEPFRRLSQYIPNLMGNVISLQPLTRDTARELVRKAAAGAGFQIEPAAVDLLVAAPAAASGSGVHPLFLRLGAEHLFDRERVLKSDTARVSTIEGNGGVDRLILESLDPVIDEMGITHVELFFRWIQLLRGADGTRTAVTEKALMDYSGKWDRFAMTLLPVLLKEGILRTVELSPGQAEAGARYEFARVSMVPVVYDWWIRKEAAIVARQRAAFRVRSISIAVGAILAAYGVYLYLVARKII